MYFQKELSQLSTIDYDQAKKVFQGTNKRKKNTSVFTLDEVFKVFKFRK